MVVPQQGQSQPGPRLQCSPRDAHPHQDLHRAGSCIFISSKPRPFVDAELRHSVHLVHHPGWRGGTKA